MTLNVANVVFGARRAAGPECISSGVHREQSQTEKIFTERQSYAGKCLVDVRGQRSDWLETIERQLDVK